MTKITYSIESSHDFEDQDGDNPEEVVVVADGGDEFGTRTVGFFPMESKPYIQELLEFINNPSF